LTRDDDWARVWKRGVLMSCRVCRGRVWARRSHLGTRFMYHAHDVHCASNGESDTHNRLKRDIATAARAVGWVVDVEASSEDSDVGGWRADLLVTCQDSNARVAVEVQLSPQTEDEALSRTNRYRRDGIDTLWVSTAEPHWRDAVPCGVIDPETL